MKKNILFLVLGMASSCVAQYGWRVNGGGVVEHAGIPLSWSENENILWKTSLPDFSNASPVACGNRVFVGMEPSHLLCLDVNSGQIVWQADNSFQALFGVSDADIEKANEIQKKINRISARQGRYYKTEISLREAKTPEEKKKYRELLNEYDRELAELKASFGGLEKYSMSITFPSNGYSSATPVCDGKHVYAVYGTGVVTCYTLDGKQVWAKLLEKPPHRPGHPRGFSSSPCISGDTLFVHINHLVALDKNTGEEIWRTEALSGYGTPRLLQIEGVDLLMTERGDVFRVDNGKRLAHNLANFYDITANSSASPILRDGIAYFIHREGRAVRLPESLENGFKTQVLWQLTDQLQRDEYNATPVLRDGIIYAVSRKGFLHALNAEKGSLIYRERLVDAQDRSIQPVYTSPTWVDGKLYICGKGNTIVVESGPEFKRLAVNSLDDDFWSTPLILEDRIVIRGKQKVYCISND